MESSARKAWMEKLPACWRDVAISPHRNAISVLDGVRGLAVLLVLASHSGVMFRIGTHGVLIFFILSGFLLTSAVANEKNALSPRYWGRYSLRRLLRIIPPYVFYLASVTLLFDRSEEWLLRHLFFLWADGHLWSIKHEILFYAMLPFLVIPLALIRGYYGAKSILLLIAAFLADTLLTKDVFSIMAGHPHTLMRFIVAPFIMGMAAAYFSQSNAWRIFFNTAWVKTHGNSILTLIAFALTYWSYGPLLYPRVDTAVQLPFLLSVIYALLILQLCWQAWGWIYALFNSLFLRALGIVGYSFYLWHGQILRELRVHISNDPYMLFWLGLAITYSLACVIYVLVEKPFMQLGRRL